MPIPRDGSANDIRASSQKPSGGSKGYDGLGFLAYPGRRGWDDFQVIRVCFLKPMLTSTPEKEITRRSRRVLAM